MCIKQIKQWNCKKHGGAPAEQIGELRDCEPKKSKVPWVCPNLDVQIISMSSQCPRCKDEEIARREKEKKEMAREEAEKATRAAGKRPAEMEEERLKREAVEDEMRNIIEEAKRKYGAA